MTDTTTAQNTNVGDNSLSMHTSWWSSGWGHVLPQHQGMLLSMVLGTAPVRKVQGDLDEVVQQIVGGSREGLFRLLGDDLNAPVMWLDEEELESAESDEEREEIRTDAAEHEATLTGALRAAGMPVPTTVRELVQTMLDLKLVAAGAPAVLPGPGLGDLQRELLDDPARGLNTNLPNPTTPFSPPPRERLHDRHHHPLAAGRRHRGP